VNQDKTKEESELLAAIGEGDQLNKKLIEQGNEVVRRAQLMRDNNRLATGLVNEAKLPQVDIERMTKAVRQSNDAARVMAGNLNENLTIYALSANSAEMSTSAVVSAVSCIPKQSIAFKQHFGITAPSTEFGSSAPMSFQIRNPQSPEKLELVLKHFGVAERRESLLEEVRVEMLRCGLDRGHPPHRSALSLLDDHARAVQHPTSVDPDPNGPLMLLRASMDRAILDVLQRCQPQEEGGSAWEKKLLSIGNRCGRVTAPNGYFQGLAQQFHVFWNRSLSGEGKDNALGRDQVLTMAYNLRPPK
jgi:hypothetical protein